MRTLSRKKQRISDRLRVVIGQMSQREFARRIDISPSTLWEYLNGRIPPADFIVSVCKRFNISEKWLLTGEGKKHQKKATYKDTNRRKNREDSCDKTERENPLKETVSESLIEEYILLVKNKIYFGGDLSEIIRSEQIVNHLAFSPHWIRKMRLEPKQTALINVIGNSMEPTIKEGDLVLIDLRQSKVKDDGLYAIRSENTIFVKRLERMSDNAILIKNDNVSYSNRTISKDATDSLCILGRVVWFGKKV